MATKLKTIIAKLPAGRRKRVAEETERLVAAESVLQELRKSFRLTQTDVAEALGIRQHGVSRIERRGDLLLSTLRDYVDALGGRLVLFAEFPDRPPVAISGLGEESVARNPAPKRRGKSNSSR